MASLLLNRGELQPVTYNLVGEVITIGRDPSNDIVINDPTVSTHHASVTKTPAGYRLRDLGSTNGTQRNSVRIADADVKDGDEIRFGSVAAVFRGADANSDQSDGSNTSVGSVGITPVIPETSVALGLNRKRYLIRWFLMLAVVLAAMGLFVAAPKETVAPAAGIVFTAVAFAAFFYNIFGLSIPRLRNAGISLWALLLLLIPLGPLLMFVICAAAPSKEEVLSQSSAHKVLNPRTALLRISRRRVFAALGVLAIIAISIGGWFAVAHYQRTPVVSVDLVSLAKETGDAVVLIQVFDSAENKIATGSGFFVSPDGLLVTLSCNRRRCKRCCESKKR